MKVLTAAKSPQQVFNWRTRGFPARLYLVMTDALTNVECAAPAKLWGVVEPHNAASEAERAAV